MAGIEYPTQWREKKMNEIPRSDTDIERSTNLVDNHFEEAKTRLFVI
jgi:hypothetical protein